ncbi:MAG: MoaD/ThiS family protein [Acidimicrobiia bacterium]|nr:MoaD/ThiS family protein [Acidimicrobiia bacterium]
MRVDLRLNPGLAELAGHHPRLTVEVPDGASVDDLLAVVASDHPALARRVRDEQGRIRRHVNVFVGTDNIRDLDGPATVLANGVEVAILPAVSGG